MRRIMMVVAALVLCLPALGAKPKPAAKEVAPPRITLAVDATEAPRKIFHAHLSMLATAGPQTFYYPKWAPGEHGPTGPIADLAGLKFTADGKPVDWRRDDVDMYAIHVDVPQGATTLEASLDYLSPAAAEGFTSAASATEHLAVVSWNTLLLYPQGWKSSEIIFTPSLRLPAGWKYGTSLTTVKQSGDSIEFAPVTLEFLADSPVLAGHYFERYSLGEGEPAHGIYIAADSAAALEAPPELVAEWRNLVAETGALFGARHYRHYDFLLTLSDHTAHFGLEHHESSDDRVMERSLIDENWRKLSAGLLPHEMTHSWNGKYRRPAGLATPDFQQPMKGELLWVYEGLTTYLGDVLTARSGLRSPELYREALALSAAEMDHRPGRTWRDLEDTAVAAQNLYGGRGGAWASWRRTTDFYPESELIWLEADTIIRQQSGGTKSLDDFCRRFHGGESGPPKVVTYTFDDIVANMNEVQAYDWRSFFQARLHGHGPGAPLGGVESSGWKLVYNDVRPSLQKAGEEARKYGDFRFSLGITVLENGDIPDTIAGMPAADAGIGPGMTLIAVNGQKYRPAVLREALRAAKGTSEAIELLIRNGDTYKTFRVNYHEGEKYPHLVRDESKPDLLSSIIKAAAK